MVPRGGAAETGELNESLQLRNSTAADVVNTYGLTAGGDRVQRPFWGVLHGFAKDQKRDRQ
jgi:hypothetical protein